MLNRSIKVSNIFIIVNRFNGGGDIPSAVNGLHYKAPKVKDHM